MLNSRLLICLALISALSACSRGDSAGQTPTSIGISDPNSFAQFFNPQVSLQAGSYTIVAATTAAASDTYTLTVTDDNGTTQTYNGSWSPSGGKSTSGNPTYPLTMTTGGGITIQLTSGSADPYLFLVDSSGTIVAQDDNTGGGTTARIAFAPPINSQAYAKAYYAMIDSSNNEDTLDKWKAANGFGAGYNEHVIFHDVKDLGYGRNMYVRGSTATQGDVAVYVENFAVDAGSGQYANSSLNLDAAISNDTRWHIGTNAIEYSTGPSGQRIVKFFNFAPDGTRNLMVDLDGRGPKAMPGACIYCHGGRTDPLTEQCNAGSLTGACSWVFPRQGDVWGRMQGIEVDAVEFSTQPGYTRADQEAALKAINQTVLCTYPMSAASTLSEDACRILYTHGRWFGDNAAEMIKSWYGGTNPPLSGTNMPNSIFADNYVPQYWQTGQVYYTAVPSGSDSIYRDVFAPSCRACHVLRGTDNQYDLDFSAWETTISATYGYNDRIKSHVFDKGNMPLALLVYNAFWGSGNGSGTRPWMLANALDTPNRPTTDVGGNPLQPGRPIANPGPNNRTTTTPVKLSAATSLFANTYQWSIVSGPTTPVTATLTNATTATPTFDASTDGQYVLRLVVGNGTTQSSPVDLTINVLNSASAWGAPTHSPLPKDIRFSDIRAILQSTAGVYGGTSSAGCSGCHNSGGGYNMVVYYADANRVGNSCNDTSTALHTTGPCTDAQNMHQFYLDIRARINFADPEDSLILRKPSGYHHGGTQINGFGASTTDGMLYYNIFLEWIMNGAPEY